MATIYYPKGSVVLKRDTQSGSYEQVSINVSPNTILYFDTSSVLNSISASTLYLTASNAVMADTSISASYALTTTLADVALIADQALTASLTDTASYSHNSDNTNVANYAYNAGTASLVETASHVIGSVELSGSIYPDINASAPDWREGQMFYDNNAKTLAVHTDHSGVTLQVGQENWIRAYADEFIPNGSAVYIHLAYQGLPCAGLALADGYSGKYAVVGIATEAIQSGSIGIITTLGQIHDLDLSAFSVGDSLWLSTTTSGSYVNAPPIDPYQRVLLGYVLNNVSGSSVIQVDITALPQSSYAFVGMTNVPSFVTQSSSSGSIVTIGTGSVNLCTTTNGTGRVKNYTLNSASFAITTSFLDVQFIVAKYNNGSPIYDIVTDRSSIDSIQTTLVYTALLGSGGSLSYMGWDAPGVLLANKDYLRVQALRGVERETGLALAETGSRYFTVSGGRVWIGPTPKDLSPVTSSVNRVILAAHSASVWSGSNITQFTNTQCDNGTNVVALGGGSQHWTVNWVYRATGNLNSTVVTYGPDFTSLASAQASQPPEPPPELKEVSVLVGRAIYQKNVTPAVQVDSAFTKNFTTAITYHNDLFSIQGGVAGEYYHLRLDQWSAYGSQSISSSFASSSISASYAPEFLPAYRTVTTDVSILGTDGIVYGSASVAPIVLTLPSPSTVAGKIFRIKKIDNSGYNVVITSSVNIDYSPSLILSQRGSAVTIHSDSAQYWIH